MQYALRRWRRMSAATLSVAGTVLLAVLLMLTVVSGALADGIMLQVKDASLKEVVMLLIQQSGANIVVTDDSQLGAKKVTASLSDVPIEKALDYVVKSAGVSYKKYEDGTYVIGGSILDEPVLRPSDIAASLSPVEQPVVVAPKPKIKTAVVKLIHSRPSDLLRVMGWTGRNPVPNSEVAYPYGGGYPVSAVKKNSRRGPDIFMPSRDGDIYDWGKGVPTDNNRQPVMPTIDPTGRNYGAGRTADESTGSAQIPTPPRGGITGYPPRAGQQNLPQAQPQVQTQTQSSNFLWPEGLVGDPVPFDLDNSIIIKGDEDAIAEFKNMVRMLDIPPKQVEIKAEFVEVKTKDIKNFGIDWSLQTLNETFSTQFGPAGNVLYAVTAGNLTANLAAQLTKDVGRIVNAPIISTLNNQWANISITSEIPFFTSTTIITETGPVTAPNIDVVSVDTGLGVLPRVNGDGTVTMTLQPRIADTGNFVTGPEGIKAPETRSQEIFTQRRVANGETIVVGGFIRKNDSASYQKIPILGDLPIIGSLFRTTAKSYDDQELLIFVTPRIIPDTGAGTVGGDLVH